MDKNTTTMERRFSFNTSGHSHPIAESTCLNGSRSMANSSHFQWGGTPISPKNRSSSSMNLSHSIATPSSPRSKLNVKKLDPRMYADVESKGLASRIVKYHEHGSRLNRSMSTSNLYTKPGDFPIVHLKKTALPYRATKPNLTMTRIAPPEKSMFQGSSLTSLLRSNSVIGLKKSDEEISRENRPILHPPATEGEMEPTRSVLDVLKEISRKRINSDDLEPNDSMKKYCSRDEAVHGDNPMLSYETAAGRLGNAYVPSLNQSQKRQREQMNGAIHQTAKTSSIYIMQQQQQQQHLHGSPQRRSNWNCTLNQNGSPEQVAKRRISNYNNDITSSLSSSVLHTNKRKLYDEKQKNISPNVSLLNDSSAKNDDESLRHKPKIAKQQPQTDLRLLQSPSLAKSLSCGTPITPLPPTPLTQVDAVTPNTSLVNAYATTTGEGVPKRSASTPVGVTATKPKLTLFNAKCDDKVNPEAANAVADDADDEDRASVEHGDSMGIQFVKPKKKSAAMGKNPLIERTQKSKLALMLCGLRGELYQGDESDERDERHNTPKRVDEIDAAKNNAVPQLPLHVHAIATTPATALTTTTTSALSTATAAATTTTPAKSGIVGINALKSTAAANATATSTATTKLSSPPSSQSTTTAAVAPTFQFTPPAASTAAAASTTTTTSPTAVSFAAPAATAKSPLVGLKLTPAPAAGPAPPTATAPSFSFGLAAPPPTATTTTSQQLGTATSTTATTAVPQLMGFSFGAPPKTSGTGQAATATTTTTTAIQFGAPKAATTSSGFTFGSAGGATAAPAKPIPTFGSFSAPTTAPTTTANAIQNTNAPLTSNPPAMPTFGSVVTQPATPFAFGSTATNTTAAATTTATATPTAAPIFGAASSAFGGPATATSSAPPSTPFAFGSANGTTNQPTQSSGGTFAFGASAMQKPAAVAAPFSFNAAAPAASASGAPTGTPFAFGAAATNTSTTATTTAAPAPTTTNAFTFGSAAKPSAATPAGGNGFSFGAPSTATAPAPPNPTSNSLFGGDASKPANAASPFAFGGAAAGAAATPAPAQQAAPTNLFGATTGVVKPSFSFGGTPQTNTNATPDPSKSLFGSSGASAAGNVFGGATANSAQSKTFAFGSAASSSSSTSNNATGGSSFFGGGGGGGATAATPTAATPLGANTNVAKPFAFGASSTNAMITPIKPTPAPGNMFAFGGGANAPAPNATENKVATNAVSPFSFGGAAAQPNKPFAFGSAAAAAPTTATPNLFAANNNSSAGAFNFSAGAGTPTPNVFGGGVQAAPPNAAGLFAPQTGSSERPIRRATRRLHKS